MSIKEELMEYQKLEWEIPNNINNFELALKTLEVLKSTDWVLRDELGLTALWVLIMNDLLEDDQLKLLLDASCNQLTIGLGEQGTDTVFGRAFTVLIIRWIIKHHNDKLIENGRGIFSKKEIFQTYQYVIEYFRQERDLRGYDEHKGWAHAVAHTGDAFTSFAESSEVDSTMMLAMLESIRDKVTICHYVFINEEAERLTTPCVIAMKRRLLAEDRIIEWVHSFKEVQISDEFKLENPLEAARYQHYFKENTKNFLRSLYFRLEHKGLYPKVTREVVGVLAYFNDFYNKK